MAAPEIGVAVLHGIGSQNPEYAKSFIELLSTSLLKQGVAPEVFAIEPVFWAEVLEPEESELLAAMQAGGIIDWNSARKFVIATLADAVAYRRGYPKGWDAYNQIHWEVFRSLAALGRRVDHPRAPLIAIAHSLGSVILSDHIWDEQKGEGFGRDAFTKCETLAGVITFGSNIPLFTLGLTQVRCIAFPPPANILSEPVRAASRWRNYYDRDDVLGYPLRTLSQSYANTVEEDVELNAGNVVTSWNVLSHNGYWSEETFVDAVARQLVNVYRALRQ